MASAYIILPVNGADLPDGSASNLPAVPIDDLSTGTPPTNAPKVAAKYWGLTSSELHLLWTFALPADYISGGKVRVKWKMQTATSGNVNLKAASAIPIDGTTDDDALVFDTVVTSGALGVPATAGILTDTLLTLTMTNASASRKITMMIGSEATGWTAAGLLIVTAVTFEYVR